MPRNPVDRAYSRDHLNVRRGKETGPFEEAIGDDAALVPGATRRRVLDARRSTDLARGRYAEHLERGLTASLGSTCS